MAQLLTGVATIIQPGVYQMVYNSVGGSGTGLLAVSKNSGSTYQTMTNGTFTTSEDQTMYLGGGTYKATLTGDAILYLDKVHT